MSSSEISITSCDDLTALIGDSSTMDRLKAELAAPVRTHNDYVIYNKVIGDLTYSYYYTVTIHEDNTYTCKFQRMQVN